jgi:hypothetical protein
VLALGSFGAAASFKLMLHVVVVIGELLVRTN